MVGAVFIFVSLFILIPLKGNTRSFTNLRIPKPKIINLNQSEIIVGPRSEIIVQNSIQSQFDATIKSFKNVLKEMPETGKPYHIFLKVLTDDIITPKLSQPVLSALNHKEAYWIEISGDNIIITGADRLGSLHGLTTLEDLLQTQRGTLNQGSIIDWPDHTIRAVHFAIQAVTVPEIKNLISLSRFGHYNTLILQLADGVRLKTMERIARDDAWSIQDIAGVTRFARENGFEIVPEVKFLTHQEKLLKDKYPELMFNRVTYDPRNEKVYTVVLPMIDEIVDIIQPKAIHIGHDEAGGFNQANKEQRLEKNEEMLPPKLFVTDVKRLHAYLKKCRVETWMWGDMLMAPDEFPSMDTRYGFHGSNSYAKIRGQIPRDIVICDWHYVDNQTEFPSALQFLKEGHRVIGATWKHAETIRNFSKYLSTLSSDSEGMIATTWYHVQRKEWNIVTNILKTSAEAFWNAK